MIMYTFAQKEQKIKEKNYVMDNCLNGSLLCMLYEVVWSKSRNLITF